MNLVLSLHTTVGVNLTIGAHGLLACVLLVSALPQMLKAVIKTRR